MRRTPGSTCWWLGVPKAADTGRPRSARSPCSKASSTPSSCPESLASEAARSALVAAADTDTVTTRLFDIGLGYPWPARYPERVIRSGFWEHWAGREEALTTDPAEASGFVAARTRGAHGAAHVDAGQGVGGISESLPAAAVVDRLRSGAIALLRAWATGPGVREPD